ncbi:MAG: hypothetical protein KC619_11035 [Myxococcales bacterium]|nr:hypothetical protein [Myxococcales bacterium]
MRIAQDERFRRERARFALRFCCESCAQFDPDRERCAYRYPIEEHREARYRDPQALLVFCKDFDFEGGRPSD